MYLLYTSTYFPCVGPYYALRHAVYTHPHSVVFPCLYSIQRNFLW